MYSRRCLQMESIIRKSDDEIKNESIPQKMACFPQSKEYVSFVNAMASVVEKYGAEILEEIDCAV
ncbi:MAG: hypothetical protein GX198_03445 [Epulopiscium sp.]|nr:hypothetical protein [Candidatus Epulonipiscium sp.]